MGLFDAWLHLRVARATDGDSEDLSTNDRSVGEALGFGCGADEVDPEAATGLIAVVPGPTKETSKRRSTAAANGGSTLCRQAVIGPSR